MALTTANAVDISSNCAGMPFSPTPLAPSRPGAGAPASNKAKGGFNGALASEGRVIDGLLVVARRRDGGERRQPRTLPTPRRQASAVPLWLHVTT